MPLLDELVHDFTLVMDIHEDQNVGHQMPILDDLALLVSRIGGNGAPVAECDELNKPDSSEIWAQFIWFYPKA